MNARATATDSPIRPTVNIEIWSDVVCPWCYIGKRRFSAGLHAVQADLLAAGIEVDFAVSYHAYQLDPTAAPGAAGPVIEVYAKKFGGPERAASIIAKVTRDHQMIGLDQQYPQYGFAIHKGYGVQAHLDALAKHGPSPLHRITFGPCKARAK